MYCTRSILLYMIVIVNCEWFCVLWLWRMIAIPGDADKRMSGSVCGARDRESQKQTIVQTRGMRSSSVHWSSDQTFWLLTAAAGENILHTNNILSQTLSIELKSCAGRQDIGGWCIGMQELACVPACAPGGGRQPGQPGQTRSRQTCWSQAQPPRLACRDLPAQEDWAFCPGLLKESYLSIHSAILYSSTHY